MFQLPIFQGILFGVHRIPRALAHTFVQKKKIDKRNPEFDSQNFPWEASPKAFSVVISDKNIGRTDKLSDPVKLQKQSFHMVWVSYP